MASVNQKAPRNVQSLAGQEPSCDERDGKDEKQKAKSVAVRCGILLDRHQRRGGVDGLQRNGRGNNDHRQHGNDNPGADTGAGESVRAGSGHKKWPPSS
jgi:hypothetical protein